MTLAHKLVGNAMQMAVCQLGEGQTVYCEAGKFLWKTTNVGVETRLTRPVGNQAGAPAAAGGFLQKALDVGKRVLAGESLAFQYYSAYGGTGLVSFAGVLPGEMQVLELDGSTTWFAEKDAFVAAEAGVKFDIAFSGLRQGMSGGEGFVLEKFTGQGSLIIAGAGNFVDINPADYGGRLKVDTGCVVAWDDRISYGIERVGALNRQGVMNAVFGGEGLSLATLTGNGRVILQSMTLTGLAGALAKAAEHSRDSRAGNANGAGGFGGIGGLFGSTD